MLTGIICSNNYYNMYEYTIEKSRFGLYTSVLTDGTRMVTGMTEESVQYCTDNIVQFVGIHCSDSVLEVVSEYYR